MTKKYWQAVAVMVGYTIGVGMFGLPYLISRAGVLTFFIFLILVGLIQYLLHLIYASLIVATKNYHRLPGYAEIYLGKAGKIIVFIAKAIGSYGALLAYIIITGIFLHQLLSPYFGGSEFLYASLLFFAEAIIVFFGIGMIARAELFMTSLLFLVIILIAWRGWGAVEISNYTAVQWKYFLLPYGAMLFALDGGGSLPIVAKLLKRDKKKFKSVVRIGTFLPILVIAVFTLIIVGISGGETSPDALSGIGLILKDGVIFFSLIFGILTMVTSFFGVAESVKETFHWDFGINKDISWALAVFVPYALYLLGMKNLINVISFAGAVAGGLCGIILVLIFIKLKSKKSALPLFMFKPGLLINFFLIGLFVCGILYEIYYFLMK